MSRASTRTLAPRLLAWHAGQGRHDLPWQKNRTPYRVWVSEVMLQQTQVETVVPYFQRFMRSFPTVRALAHAPLDEVLHLWSGLGYYARARNLHRAACLIVEQHGGKFPRGFDDVLALPGIGRSTAGAILAQARGERHAILDGNVKRVLCRYFGVEGWPGDAAVELQLWDLAERCTPRAQLANYTQAIMDLGATLCTRRAPDCSRCPLSRGCQARELDAQETLPTARPKGSARRRRSVEMLFVVRKGGEVMLRQRATSGLWGGLWTPPEFTDPAAMRQWCREQRLTGKPRALPLVRHVFTHFDLDIAPWVLALPAASAVEAGMGVWYNPRGSRKLGLPAPVAKLISTGVMT